MQKKLTYTHTHTGTLSRLSLGGEVRRDPWQATQVVSSCDGASVRGNRRKVEEGGAAAD